MESLQVRTGQISLRILDDAGEERGIFRFNPEDVESARRVVSLQKELDEKQREFELRYAQRSSILFQRIGRSVFWRGFKQACIR